MTTTPVLISVKEYLNTVYRPDCDYINGEVLERNMGELPHGGLQGFFTFFFRLHEDELGIVAAPETRLQVTIKDYRVPDIMVLAIPYADTRIVRTPPLLCIEILSSEDHMRRVQERIDDYARMGVRTSWVVDPWRETAFQAGADGVLHSTEDRLTVPGTEIAITVAELWAELDRVEKRATTKL
jgi:Uma2 family endonuclease